MYTVPAVASRLLRFQGSLLHGVPRPALRYMDMDTRSSYDMLFDVPGSRRKHLMQDVNSIPTFLYGYNHSRDSHPTGAMNRGDVWRFLNDQSAEVPSERIAVLYVDECRR